MVSPFSKLALRAVAAIRKKQVEEEEDQDHLEVGERSGEEFAKKKKTLILVLPRLPPAG